uniref:Ubiquitin carboxyl-terminal hydrolase 2 n=1 Tax=Gasterosteus aculeatus TaxID=69293 RepID=G3NMU6_GASAC
MSRVSSTAKRYAGSSYTSQYGSYSSSLTPGLGSYSERDRLSSYRSPACSSGYSSSSYLSSSAARSRNYSTSSDTDRGRTVPRTDLLGSSSRRSESLSRTPLRSYGGSGLSGGSGYTTAQSSYLSSTPAASGIALTRRKSASQSDLSRDLASLGLSDASSSSTSSTSALRSYRSRASDMADSYAAGSRTGYTGLSRSSTQEAFSSSRASSASSWQSDPPTRDTAPEPTLPEWTGPPSVPLGQREESEQTQNAESCESKHSPVGRLQPNSKSAQGLVGLKNLGNTVIPTIHLGPLTEQSPQRAGGPVECLYTRQQDHKINACVCASEPKRTVFKQSHSSAPHAFLNTSSLTKRNQNNSLFYFIKINFLLYIISNTYYRKASPLCFASRDEEKGKKMWSKYLEREDSKIVDVFVGQLKSSLTCSHCGFCSTVFDPFWDLSLPIAKQGYGDVSLMDCMRLFTKEDVLDGDEKPTCYRCKARRRCTKKFTIQKFPKILVLHLKRFSEARRTSKLSTFVNFPMKDLDLREFASQHSIDAVYNLYAVSNHSGTTMGGHYTAYCRSPSSGEWYTFNDSRVTPMSSSQVRSSDAYVLFYELASSSRM